MLDHQVIKLLRKFYRGGRTAFSKRCEAYVEKGEWGELQQLRIEDPSIYRYPGTLKWDLAVVDFFRKVPLVNDVEKLHGEAVATFYRCEALCAATNVRLAKFVNHGPFSDPDDLRLSVFIDDWRKNAKDVLGKLPNRLEPVFTQGATLSDKGSWITIPDKMSSCPTVYGSCIDIFRHSVVHTVLDKEPQVVRANRFFSVVKDSVKRRGCCVEASGAVLLQRGAALAMRLRYEKYFKVDMKTAPIEIHQRLAREGSLNGEWCTIDLSDASDLICEALVKLVLPGMWFELLNSLRAKYSDVEGKLIKLSKFSSMGNGFTFEVMTLLLRTLCMTLGAREAYVFGDDILVRKEDFKNVLAALRYFGLVPNMRKTFSDGPFRESCGGDFHTGQAVRPYSMSRLPDEPQHWIAIANGIRRTDPTLSHFGAAWWFCVEQVPVSWRNFTADPLLGAGDGCFYDPLASPLVATIPPVTSSDGTVLVEGHEALVWRFYRPVNRKVTLDGYSYDVALAAAALTQRHEFALRDQVSGYKTAMVEAWH